MNKFLFELGTEEIPAAMIAPALEQLVDEFKALLRENEIEWDTFRTFDSPRRLALRIEGLPDSQPPREELILGPPRSIGLDDSGEPTRAGVGFAGKMGVTPDRLELVSTERGEYLGFRRRLVGRPVPAILGESLAGIISRISWPRNMYWRPSRFRFIRPLRWIVALWNAEIVDFELEGVAAGRSTRGHRFLGESRVDIPDAAAYEELLREQFVLVDPGQRRDQITKELREKAPAGLQVRPDQELLDTVVCLNEYPTVLAGTLGRRFLEIPQEILITVMRHHQKYFAVVNEEDEIQPWFLTVANCAEDPGGAIRKGHERVLKARLYDAVFFWQTDQKQSLDDRVASLQRVVFQKELGTYLDKTQRLRRLCAQLCDDPNLEKAAWLCKADLTTEMVFEMSELQGIMGGLYARQEGHPREVWQAIYEHYKPVSLEDTSPSTRNGAVLAIADKLDTIVGCFGIGILPTGSSDPFALRRQAQGIVRVLLDHRLGFGLDHLIRIAQENFAAEIPPEQTRRAVLEFMERRVRFIFQEKGISYDVLNALCAVGIDQVPAAYEKAVALTRIKSEDDFEALALGFKRIKNILSDQSIEAKGVRESDLKEKAEVELHREVSRMGPLIAEDLEKAEYLGGLRRIASLRAAIDRFFDEVLVMAPEERLRKNRLRLLDEISQLFLRFADISELVREDRG